MKTVIAMTNNTQAELERGGRGRTLTPNLEWNKTPFAFAPLLQCFIFGLALCCVAVVNVQADKLLLRGATVHTVSGATLTHGDVLIDGTNIVAVGQNLEAADLKVEHLSGMHLYPGLIASTSSLGLTEIHAVRATQDTSEVGEFTPDVQAWIAVNPDSELLPVARANGITHALIVPMGGIVSGQSGVMSLDGWTTEQMAARCPAAMHLFWPAMQLDTTPKEQARDKTRWKSLEEQAKDRRKRVKEVEDFFAEGEAYVKTRGHNGTERANAKVPAWEAMLPVLEGKIPLMIHADAYRQIKAAIEWATSKKYKVILAGGRDAWMLADWLAEKKVPVIFERVFLQPTRDTESYDVHFRAPAVLHKAGVRVLFSEGLGGEPATQARNLPYAAAQAVAFGLPADEALKGMTLYAAQCLQVADRLGSIDVGKEATLFAADGDILDIRSTVKRMWVGGKETSLETRHTRLYQKYKNRPRPDAK